MITKTLLSAALLFIGACTYKTASQDEILIGEYGSLTGSESAYGQDTHRGIVQAIAEQNEKGGVLGKKIRLITYDDQGRTDEAVTAITRLIIQDKVSVVLGEVASTRSIAAGNIAQRYQVPMIASASTNADLTKVGDYIFRVCFIDDYQGEVMAKFAIQNLRLKTGAILSDVKSDYSLGLTKSFEKSFTALGGTILTKPSYTSGDLDFKTQALLVKKSGADFLFIPGYYTEVGLIARQLREAGYKGILLGGDGWDSDKLTEIGQSAMAGSYFANHYFYEDGQKSAFADRYKKENQNLPNSSVALGYDSALLAIQAIERAGSLDPKKIRDQIASTKGFQGVTGVMTLSKDREVQKPAVILQIKPSLQFAYFANVK